MSVFVVGAGIMGLSTAVYIQEKEPRAKVTLVAEKFSGDTTSDVAAGHWRPVYLQDHREDIVKRWASLTYNYIGELYREDPDQYGAGRMSGYELYTSAEVTPFWADCLPDFRRVGAKELDSLGWADFRDAFFFTTYYLECKKYLPVLLHRFNQNGGIAQQRKLTDLSELDGLADVIVNCTGLGSYDLVGDESCYPIRGQVFKVHAPFVKHFVTAGSYYILPNHQVVTLGGTNQAHDWRMRVDKADSDAIWEATTALYPSITKATVLGEMVGLRPGRPSIRLEIDSAALRNRTIPIVHNYGHGGSGITLHHGCALDAAVLVQNALHKRSAAA